MDTGLETNLPDLFVGDFNYTSAQGLVHAVSAIYGWADTRTGADTLVRITNNLLGGIPITLVNTVVNNQFNILGGYPGKEVLAGSIIFIIVNVILLFSYISIFIFNLTRGHLFWPHTLLIIYSASKIIGWSLFLCFNTQKTMVNSLIGAYSFLIASSIFLVACNLIFSQRIFTWRHPVGGDRKLFNNVMYGHYIVVVMLIIMALYCQATPYARLLKPSTFDKYYVVVRLCSVLVVMYTLTATILIALSYFLPPTANDENLYTYQPWWIESFSPFYYVRPGAAREAEQTFMKRTHNHRHAVRVIAATHHHYKVVSGLSNARGDLKHNISLIIISISTMLLFIQAVVRCVSVFGNKQYYDQDTFNSPAMGFIMFGLFEFIINLLFLVGRVDLRFYRPDVLPAIVRSIITAEQTNVIPSRVQTPPPISDEESLEFDGPLDKGGGEDEFSFDTHSHSFPLDKKEKEPAQIPYPRDEKYAHYDSSDDNMSEFRF